jgi:hypothetical protein
MYYRQPRLVVLPPQHLGHEIHVGRNIVVDMLSKGVLERSKGDFIMTGLPDRRFFYEAFMGADQVIDFSNITEIEKPIHPPKNASDYLMLPSQFFSNLANFKNFQIINLSSYSLPPTYCTFGTSDEMLAVGYSVPERYWNKNFQILASTFNFLTTDEINEIIPVNSQIFIVLHHRYNASIEKLKLILESLPLELYKVIFTSNIEGLKFEFNNRSDLIFTNNLKEYSSLLKDPRCKLLISEWSGAGQVAQYTLGSQGSIWFYYDHYPDVYNFSMTHKVWENNAKIGSYFNCWDFKNITGSLISHFPSFENLIANCKKLKISSN